MRIKISAGIVAFTALLLMHTCFAYSFSELVANLKLPTNFQDVQTVLQESANKLSELAKGYFGTKEASITTESQDDFDPYAEGLDDVELDPDEISILFRNLSPFRVSVWWDQDENLRRIIDLLEPGETVGINTFVGHRFLFTREGTRDVIGEPIYISEAESLYILPEDAKTKADDPCADRYTHKCPTWASEGECERNPGWMIVNCPTACNACHLLDPHKRCDPKFLNVSADPIWKPNDLDDMFKRILQDYASIYNIEVFGKPPEKPWVLKFNNFLTDGEVERLLYWGKKFGYERSTDTGQPNERGEVTRVFSTGRTSSNTWCIGDCESDPIIQGISNKVVKITKVPYENYEQFQMLEYQLGQQYKPHHDMSPEDDARAGGVRILTFFLYLSDVEEGGETNFPLLGFKVKPAKGAAILWPSVLNESPMEQDPRTLHAALPVIKGTKYAANYWIHSHNFKKANKWGCTGAFD